MAIIFISPQRKQKIIIFAAIGLIAVALVAGGLFIFLAKPQPVAPKKVFKPPELKINFFTLESEELSKLERFTNDVKLEFKFKAKNKDDEVETGEVLAVSTSEAQGILKGRGLSEIEITPPKVGRNNPFTPLESKESAQEPEEQQ